MGLFDSLMGRGVEKTRFSFLEALKEALTGERPIDAQTLERVEEALIQSDMGVKPAALLMAAIRPRVAKREIKDLASLTGVLQEELQKLFQSLPPRPGIVSRPHVIMMVGVNGVGKTTTIAKLTRRLSGEGKKVLLGASDTFRAAAAEQLSIWGARTGVEVISQQPGADPSAVAFDAYAAARARGADVLIVDTAGRLHTRVNLMEELKKIRKTLGKADPASPHEVLLVLDATQGQNALAQAKAFQEAVGVTGIALTKLDSSARGGVVVPIWNDLKIPVQWVGLGEKAEDFEG